MSRIKRDKTGKFQKHDTPNVCTICGQGPVEGHGFCNRHYLRFIRYGDPLISKKAANGKGGISVFGYRMITVNGRRVSEHRHVMEIHLGRVLRANEIVHHLDGNKLNNSIANLVIHTRKTHVKHHPESLANLALGPKSRRGTM